MLFQMTRFIQFSLSVVLLFAVNANAQDSKNGGGQTPTKKTENIRTSTFQEYKGFFDFYWDDSTGRIWLQIKKFDQPFLYVTSLATGLGSNPVGLDRGQLGSTKVVQFLRVGPKVLLEHVNLKYRASANSRAEKNSIKQSFASSIIWSGTAQNDEQGAVVVDITDLIVRDAHRCAQKLSATGQGKFTLDPKRSFPYLPRTRSFPENCEFEATLTLKSSDPGPLVRRTAATGGAVSLRQHHSFVKLPDAGFRPRPFHPRSGCFSISYADYSAAIDQPIEQRLITRHRLKKQNPELDLSPPVEPIIYYLDPGVPSPVKEALLEGARWWNEAFESAGYRDAFLVKVLPETMDPMDVRYNVIQWVHRATRGWSYGQSVVDPRTGEIIKGHVLLGSLRVRQDILLNKGLLEKSNAGPNMGLHNFHQPEWGVPFSACRGQSLSPVALARLVSRDSSVEVALARIRQLSAHEVGHTLGFAHNFAASTYDDRASVMDYPAPRATIKDGKIDLSDAYGVGIGSWDKFTVQYAYAEFADAAEEKQGLASLIADANAKQMIYLSDSDARPAGAAHPFANLWDNGQEPISALSHEIKVREIALKSFDTSVLQDGEPLAELEKAFVPLYLHHRYQVDATAKVIGGVNYHYAVRGDKREQIARVSEESQRVALKQLLKTLEPEFLNIPTRISQHLNPKPYSSAADRERFSSRTAPIFDTGLAIEVAADLTIANLLQPQRLSRLAQSASKTWNVALLLEALERQVLATGESDSEDDQRTRRIVQAVFVNRLIRLADSKSAAVDVESIANQFIARHRDALQKARSNVDDRSMASAHYSNLINKLERHLNKPGTAATSRKLSEAPPGSPIGDQ